MILISKNRQNRESQRAKGDAVAGAITADTAEFPPLSTIDKTAGERLVGCGKFSALDPKFVRKTGSGTADVKDEGIVLEDVRMLDDLFDPPEVRKELEERSTSFFLEHHSDYVKTANDAEGATGEASDENPPSEQGGPMDILDMNKPGPREQEKVRHSQFS